jgi:hypothetical protein
MANDQVPVTEQSKGKLPEKDFFNHDNMSKWASEVGIATEQPPVVPAPKKPCPNCPPEKGTPYKILKVDGKEVPVYSEEELISMAQQGVDYTKKRQRDAEYEKELDARDKKWESMQDPIKKLLDKLEGGKLLTTKPEAKVINEDDPFGEPDEVEEIEDPAAKAKLEAAEKRIKELESKLDPVFKEQANKQLDETVNRLDSQYQAAKQEFPFDEVIREDTKDNVTGKVFAGFVGLLHNAEMIRKAQKPDYEPRPVTELIKEAAKEFSFMVSKYREGSVAPTQMTKDQLLQTYPELVQQIISDTKGGNPPILRPLQGGARSDGPGQRGSAKITGLDDSLRAAFNDSSVEEAFDALGKDFKNIKNYGLK